MCWLCFIHHRRIVKPRYLANNFVMHGLPQNPVYIGVHDFEASRAFRVLHPNIAVLYCAYKIGGVVKP